MEWNVEKEEASAACEKKKDGGSLAVLGQVFAVAKWGQLGAFGPVREEGEKRVICGQSRPVNSR